MLIGRPYRIRSAIATTGSITSRWSTARTICDVDPQNIPQYFSELFESIWRRRSENDAFNHLLFSACIKAENIQILRAYTAYLQQIRFPHSREYIIETLNSYPEITLLLVQGFLAKFDPEANPPGMRISPSSISSSQRLHDIESLDHDLIYKHMLNLIESTVRTNYFQADSSGDSGHISFKLDSQQVIDNLPKPHRALKSMSTPRVRRYSPAWWHWSRVAVFAGPTGAKTTVPKCWA